MLRDKLRVASQSSMDAYQRAVEADHKIMQKMLKTMTPEQIARFCFEDGCAIPEPKELNQ